MKKCNICAVENADDVHFCRACGAVFGELVPPIAPPPVMNKPIKTYKDRQAIAALVLSILGVVFPFSAPAQILAVVLAIPGFQSQKYKKFAQMAMIFAVIGLILFAILLNALITSFDSIVNSDFFQEMSRAFGL